MNRTRIVGVSQFVAALLCLLPPGAGATGYLAHGGGMHGAHAGIELGVTTAFGNPAAGTQLLPKDEGGRFGTRILGVGAEIGPVDDFVDEVEDLEKELDREGVTQEEADAAMARFNAILPQIGDAAYLNMDLGLFEFAGLSRAWGGALTWFVVPYEVTSKLTVLDAPLSYDTATEEFHSDTSLYVRSGILTRLGFGYGRDLPLPLPAGQALALGLRLNAAYAQLYRRVAPLEEDNSGSGSGGEGNGSATEETEATETDLPFETSLGYGVDVGMTYRLAFMQAGLTIHNLLPPKYEFNAIASDCTGVADPDERKSCEGAANFPGEVPLTETFKEDTRMTAEVVLRPRDTGWSVGTSADLNTAKSLFGDEYQWLSVTGGYSPSRFWIPGIALSFRKNMAGSELSYIGVGLNLFGFLRLDASQALKSVRYEGEDYPRSAAFTLRVERPL